MKSAPAATEESGGELGAGHDADDVAQTGHGCGLGAGGERRTITELAGGVVAPGEHGAVGGKRDREGAAGRGEHVTLRHGEAEGRGRIAALKRSSGRTLFERLAQAERINGGGKRIVEVEGVVPSLRDGIPNAAANAFTVAIVEVGDAGFAGGEGVAEVIAVGDGTGRGERGVGDGAGNGISVIVVIVALDGVVGVVVEIL